MIDRGRPWRVGTHYLNDVYTDDDVPVATFHTSVDAAAAVEAHNAMLTGVTADAEARFDAVTQACLTQRDEALATIERVRALVETLTRLRDKAAEDEDAGYRNAINYADAYENATRLIREALEQP